VDLGTSPKFGLPGQAVTLTAQVGAVAPGVAVPTGIVAFYRGTTLLGTGTLNNGVATLTTQKLSAGTYNLTVVYRGDSRCQSSSTTWTYMAVNPTVISSVALTTNPLPNGTVTATVNATDPQGLSILYSYVWSVNGTTVHTDSSLSSTTDTLDLSQFTVASGDTVSVSVTAFNGITSAPSTKSTIALGPVVTGVVISTDDPTNQDVTTLTATPTATDSAGQTITYSYQWLLGGVVISGATGSSLDLTQVVGLLPGNTITVVVVPTDSASITGLPSTPVGVTIATISPTITLFEA
jgi:hypothetical protein